MSATHQLLTRDDEVYFCAEPTLEKDAETGAIFAVLVPMNGPTCGCETRIPLGLVSKIASMERVAA